MWASDISLPFMPKQQIRKEIATRKRLFSEQQLREKSFAIMESLLAHPIVIAARRVMMYHSLPDEVFTHAAIVALAKQGKQVFLPTITADDMIVPHRYHGATDMHTGAYGISEPDYEPSTAPQDDDDGDSEMDVIIVPGVAFDLTGNRLGRGKGYYDRFLQHREDIYKIGVCFDFQLVDNISTDAFDVKMDEVIAG